MNDKAMPERASALFIGLDVHTESIAVSLAPGDSTEVRRYGLIGGTHDDVLRLAKKLAAAHPGLTLRFCYEAGPHGYPPCRCLRGHGYDCILVAPSKIPRAPGQRVKTNRRDADQLARLCRAGELTAIHVPAPEDEAVRDLLRARWQTAKHRHRARQQLKSFLLRHNFRYAGTKAWTQKHLNYLATIKLPFAGQQSVFQEMVNLITETGQRLERYEAQLPGVVDRWRFAPVVKALMSLRGLALLNAATLTAELGDLHRFETARQLMGYLGLVPSEEASPGRHHRTDELKISFLAYPDFLCNPHPSLRFAITIDLVTGKSRRTDYANNINPPILHRKESFVSANHPLRAQFEELTRAEEAAGLFENAATIGFKLNWERLLATKGITIQDHRVVRLYTVGRSESQPATQIERHKTALARYELSKPVKSLVEYGLLKLDTTFFDYGCGQGGDIRGLQALGHNADGWDPVHRPDAAKREADVVNLGYVLNVIEDPAERNSGCASK